jgi:hypothetical protein
MWENVTPKLLVAVCRLHSANTDLLAKSVDLFQVVVFIPDFLSASMEAIFHEQVSR